VWAWVLTRRSSGQLPAAAYLGSLGFAGKNMQIFYVLLCIAGAALPLSQFVPWLSAHGLNVPLLLQQATSSQIASFAWADVLISGIVVAVFLVAEGRKLAMRRLWLPLSCLIVGPSLALPLFLLLRERHFAAMAPNNSFKPTPLRSAA
ncbi:DUF2834 domain-containing protein, partial [Giesbergeria sinuosa]